MYEIWIEISDNDGEYNMFFTYTSSGKDARYVAERLILIFTMLDVDSKTRVRILNGKGEYVK